MSTTEFFLMLITGQDLLAKKPLAKSDIYVRFCRVGAERVKYKIVQKAVFDGHIDPFVKFCT